ncbi:hypothetical protein BC829DRAFT_169904 [Chytridium lagenaria]|nr:hypothetical protein BC829DRAFT_169904 [Chytridium lagenaria]
MRTSMISRPSVNSSDEYTSLDSLRLIAAGVSNSNTSFLVQLSSTVQAFSFESTSLIVPFFTLTTTPTQSRPPSRKNPYILHLFHKPPHSHKPRPLQNHATPSHHQNCPTILSSNLDHRILPHHMFNNTPRTYHYIFRFMPIKMQRRGLPHQPLHFNLPILLRLKHLPTRQIIKRIQHPLIQNRNPNPDIIIHIPPHRLISLSNSLRSNRIKHIWIIIPFPKPNPQRLIHKPMSFNRPHHTRRKIRIPIS